MIKKFIPFGLMLIVFLSCQTEIESPPNIVFIMSDDHAYQAVSAYGYGLNNTPNIDRIAQEGALFQKGFVTNSICAPDQGCLVPGLLEVFCKIILIPIKVLNVIYFSVYKTVFSGEHYRPTGSANGIRYKAFLK